MSDLQNQSDEELINYMKESKDTKDWNERREKVKVFRDNQWIIDNLDASGLIVKVLNSNG